MRDDAIHQPAPAEDSDCPAEEAPSHEAPEADTPALRLPEAQTPEAPVEALLGLRDFLAVAPRHGSVAVTVAAQSALQRWMHLHGHDVHGFYTMAAWQGFYAATMASH